MVHDDGDTWMSHYLSERVRCALNGTHPRRCVARCHTVLLGDRHSEGEVVDDVVCRRFVEVAEADHDVTELWVHA